MLIFFEWCEGGRQAGRKGGREGIEGVLLHYHSVKTAYAHQRKEKKERKKERQESRTALQREGIALPALFFPKQSRLLLRLHVVRWPTRDQTQSFSGKALEWRPGEIDCLSNFKGFGPIFRT